MGKQISPKITALTFGVLAVVFLAVFYVIAWTEPTQAPPGGNVATPLNTGNAGQSKEGGLILNTGGAVNGLVIDKGNLCLGTDCRSSWSGVPSGMIAMFDASCPSGWTRFAALDGRFPQGAAAYGGTGGASAHTHGYTDKILGIGSPGPLIATGGSACSEFSSGTVFPINIGGSGGSGSPFCRSATRDTTSSSLLPPYLNVIWCKKD